MRFLPMALILGGLSACAPAVPDSAAGVGFYNSIEAQRAREAALSGTATMPGVAAPAAVSSTPLSAAGTVSAQGQTQTASAGATLTSGDSMATRGDSASDIAAETAAALRAAQSNSGEMPVQASPLNPAPAMINNAGISDENDFQAVANRETIQSDADRMARNRQMYQEIEPTAIPGRPGDDQPNIVAYALQTKNPRGAQLYSRGGLNLQGRHARNCAKYGSADLAQMAFLSKGGPKRDRMALDPDGDGYACAWDPAPFREAVKN
ncbi:hypothetical protein [Antarcticimicrobium sediminis]|uniref:Excalibur calcium-binding domain-containing protein n=1 Tax=Antarcticimicrobium sediminis TaxID=2546227 RepID=A0A4R5EH66_9RHOB|nr:hypothetical protein [Antarcticimicrobium sediminis]TDE33821.1 hypothetical protein E1B25_20695 [Antarcticimicrobium sediminis]